MKTKIPCSQCFGAIICDNTTIRDTYICDRFQKLVEEKFAPTNGTMDAIATCSICQSKLDRRAVCHSCWVAGPPPQQHQ